MEAQAADLEELFQGLFERNQKFHEAGELSASEYLEVREALNKAQEAIRSLRRTIKREGEKKDAGI
jgi:5-bromo-4-chloroindolyl phosphate hydrolysis protein